LFCKLIDAIPGIVSRNEGNGLTSWLFSKCLARQAELAQHFDKVLTNDAIPTYRVVRLVSDPIVDGMVPES